MNKDLNIRVGDIVRIREAAVERVGDDGTLTLNITMGLGFAYTTTTLHRAAIEEILRHNETPEEELERLRAELASAPRKIEWSGGKCPVDPDTTVAVWLRDGTVASDRANAFEWEHYVGVVDYDADIVAYMVLPE